MNRLQLMLRAYDLKSRALRNSQEFHYYFIAKVNTQNDSYMYIYLLPSKLPVISLGCSALQVCNEAVLLC